MISSRRLHASVERPSMSLKVPVDITESRCLSE
jgi:hypothetical protein